MRAGAGGLILLFLVNPASAQDNVCRPGKASNEARTMAKFSVPLAFSGAAGPEDRVPWRIQAGLEVSYLPPVDDATATPTICRPDKTGPENTDLLFALPRPRLTVTLPAGFAVEGSWVPPIRIAEAKANLVGVALSRTTAVGRMRIALRGHATLGHVEGPITCDDAALRDSSSPCYQGTRSNDAFSPNIVGIEATIGWTLGGRIHPYLGAGYNHLGSRFQVNFRNRFGDLDRTRVAVDLDRGVLVAGAAWTAGRLAIGGEVYSAPADAVTARVRASLRLK